MKLGLCCAPENMEIAAKLGFDYIEGAFAHIARMPQEEYDSLLCKVDSFPIPLLKCNMFLPADIPPVGPDACEKTQREYLELSFKRASKLGVRLAVFGSGAARRVPDGWSHIRAWKQLADFLDLVAEYAEKYEITVALEPLRRKECNILNLVSEGTVLCAVVNHPRITVLGDTFHMLCSCEPWDSLKYAGEKLTHIHISHSLPDLSGRVYPCKGDGEDYATVINVLKEMNYKGDISIEAGFTDMEKDGAAAIAVLRPLL